MGLRWEGKPNKVCRVGGKTFLVYREYDDICETDILVYPDFGKNPEYTAEGRPFTLSTRECCEHFESPAAEALYRDCGVCGYFEKDQETQSALGVCRCEARRASPL